MVIVRPFAMGYDSYRIFIQGSSGFVPIQSVREEAEQRANEFCDRKGGVMQADTETTADPPYILGNFPRIEIVFDCTPSAEIAHTVTDTKFTKLTNLRKLLDNGTITQAEFDAEKAMILSWAN